MATTARKKIETEVREESRWPAAGTILVALALYLYFTHFR